MKGLLAVAVAVLVGGVFAGVAQAGHIGVQANFSTSKYKYSGIAHTDPGEPTWTTTGRLTMSVQYWSFTAAGDHNLVYYGIGNNAPGTANSWWVQVGLAVGYDPWGNVLVDNYPIGTWTDANHPNDGHIVGKPQTYVPNAGHWRIIRYAEILNPSTYQWQSISTFNLSAGQSVRIRHDGPATFSIVDQNNNTLGIANHVSVPQAPGLPGYHLDAVQEDFSNDAWLDDGIFVLQSFENPTGLFWNGYYGCSGNGWNGDNALDGNCSHGAATETAPLDTWRQTSPNWGQVQNYCQECESFGPPFAQVSPDLLPPSATNARSTAVTGRPSALRSAHGLPRPSGATQQQDGQFVYNPPYKGR